MSGLPDGAITLKDLFLELKGMRDDLTRVLIHMEAVDARAETAEGKIADYEARLRILERFRYTLAGLSVVGGTLAGWIGYLLGHVYH